MRVTLWSPVSAVNAILCLLSWGCLSLCAGGVISKNPLSDVFDGSVPRSPSLMSVSSRSASVSSRSVFPIAEPTKGHS